MANEIYDFLLTTVHLVMFADFKTFGFELNNVKLMHLIPNLSAPFCERASVRASALSALGHLCLRTGLE